jgi:ferrous iron transport protein A
VRLKINIPFGKIRNTVGRRFMMPLAMAKPGESVSIIKISGNEESRQRLANLGFIPGSGIKIITEIGGNVIVSVKESRVAINRETAAKIMVKNNEETKLCRH